MPRTILEIIDLKKHFTHHRGLFSAFRERRTIPAVDGVSFYLKENETLGLVGESGCGKTTVGRTILRLEKPTSGRILFEGEDVSAMRAGELRRLRGRMQMLFQDPDAALNPRMRVRDILREAIRVHHSLAAAEVDARIGELIDQVRIGTGKLAS
jgi:ABC-type glutathione transport system ATPase component